MTDEHGGIDRDAGVRRERRREAEMLILLGVTVAALMPIRFDPTDPDDRRFFAAAGGLLAAYVIGMAIWWRSSRRNGQTDRYRCLHAIREGLDPGPGLRARTEDVARQEAPNRWVAWCYVVVLGIHVPQGHWEHLPFTIPAAAVFAAGLGIVTWRQHRLGVAAKRWLEDPPLPASQRRWLFR